MLRLISYTDVKFNKNPFYFLLQAGIIEGQAN
jgi:hypothetical protein